MRNRLAHGYTDIDSLLLWNTVDEALPAFLAELVTRIAPVDR
ncbi:HepT-like ribonuclease domain-containing protein [Brachybacterium muris]